MGRYDWFPWHRNYRQDDKFLELSPGQRWAWVAFLSWANEQIPRWHVTKMSVTLLSRRIEADEHDVEIMLEWGVENGKIVDKGDCWFVKNGEKYEQGGIRIDPTNTDRQRKYRELRKEGKGKDNVKVTRHNVTLSDTETMTMTETLQKEENTSYPPPNSDQILDEFVRDWNEKVVGAFPKIKRVNKLTPKRRERLKITLKNEEFTIPNIIEELHRSPHALGIPFPGGNGFQWVISFDYLIGIPLREGGKPRPDTWVRFLEGSHRSRQPGTTIPRLGGV